MPDFLRFMATRWAVYGPPELRTTSQYGSVELVVELAVELVFAAERLAHWVAGLTQ